jgi:hypothetical protein
MMLPGGDTVWLGMRVESSRDSARNEFSGGATWSLELPDYGVDEIAGTNDLHASISGNPEKVLVATDDHLGPSGESAGQEHVVGWIFADGFGQCGCLDDFSVYGKEREEWLEVHPEMRASQALPDPSVLSQDLG